MDRLNFYTVDLDYVNYLKRAEQTQRGFCRVPNVEYGDSRKPKFLCGVVLQINNVDYYVPVTSYKIQKPDNYLIKAANGQVTSSLRFNYMFPVPKELIAERTISGEPDSAYRALLAQELRYCIDNQERIQQLAARTYRRVLLGLDRGLVANSCAFQLLEEKCKDYQLSHNQQISEAVQPTQERNGIRERLAEAQAEANRRNGSVPADPRLDKNNDLEK